MLFAYMLVAFGALALLSRAVDRLAFLHVYAGRAFLVTMLWAMASSILIHNTYARACVCRDRFCSDSHSMICFVPLFVSCQSVSTKQNETNNSGMPRSIAFFFTLMLVCITIGFNAIRIAQQRYADAVVAKADELLSKGGSIGKQTIKVMRTSCSNLTDSQVSFFCFRTPRVIPTRRNKIGNFGQCRRSDGSGTDNLATTPV